MPKVVTKDSTGKETVRVKVKDYRHERGAEYLLIIYQDGRHELISIQQVRELTWYPNAD